MRMTLRLAAVTLLLCAPASVQAASSGAMPVQTPPRAPVNGVPVGAPLPAARAAGASAAAGKACHVGSFTGVTAPGSTICMKVGGFVRAQTGSGGGGQARP